MRGKNDAGDAVSDRHTEVDAVKEAVCVWLSTGEVGSSSTCMAMWLGFGRRVSESHPYDPDDMNRCLKLLNEVPALRERLPKMAVISKTWAVFVERWAEIEAMQMEEIGLDWTKSRRAPKTYALIQEVLDASGNEVTP